MYQNLAEKKTVLGDKPHLFPTSPFLKNVRINTANVLSKHQAFSTLNTALIL